MLYLVADHGGFVLKRRLITWLKKHNVPAVDLGATTLQRSDDYPRLAVKLARAVKKSSQHRGIAVCRTGVGMALVANKHRGIRAVQALTPAIAVRSRQDEDTNVISLAADYQTWPVVTATIKKWLATPYRGQVRHARRLRQIKTIEHGR